MKRRKVYFDTDGQRIGWFTVHVLWPVQNAINTWKLRRKCAHGDAMFVEGSVIGLIDYWYCPDCGKEQ